MTWLAAFALLSFAAVMLFVKRYEQPQAYHDFADRRMLIRGIPNTFDVLSNLAFIAAGAYGVVVLARGAAFTSPQERAAAFAMFVGALLTGIGSAVYHLRPHDKTLAWDRVGMTVGFMSFLAMIVHEHFDDPPRWLLRVLIAIGFASVFWWRVTGDLRPYGWVQFFPFIALLAITVTSPPRYTAERPALIAVVACYAIAKLCEHYDAAIFRLLGGTVSGHTLKHIAAALAPAALAVWIAERAAVSN